MNTRKIHRILPLAALLALGACSTTASEKPILSAAQIESSIRVEVRLLEPLPVGETTVARVD
jgi:hypothetical protein